MRNVIVRNDYDLSKFILEGLVGFDIYSVKDFDKSSHFYNAKRSVIYYFVSFFYAFRTLFVKKTDTILYLFAVEEILRIAILTIIFRPSRRIIWLWNPMSYFSKSYTKKFIFIIKLLDYEVWSFDKDDAEKYGFRYHHQIYRKVIKNGGNIESDVFFVGKDKGRLSFISQLYEVFNKFKVKCDFHVIPDKNTVSTSSSLLSSSMSYHDYLEHCIQSKCLLDLVQEGQEGLTVRCLEALFFKKKLITNNKNITRYDFFKKQNIFLLGDRDMMELVSFIDSPYHDIGQDILYQYDIESLLKKMEEG